MPNWCYNKLTIEDCSPELESYLRENGLSLERIKPTPPEKLDDEDGSWHGWRLENWGTKWDFTDNEQRDIADALLSEDTDFTAFFDTAWSPPCKGIAELSAMFPNDRFTLHYVEFGMCFAGTAYIANGESIEEDTSELDEVNRHAADHFDYDYEELSSHES